MYLQKEKADLQGEMMQAQLQLAPECACALNAEDAMQPRVVSFFLESKLGAGL